ncbi:hypothetical protein PILCRDRAFT_816768 [Piloderma croceum F 1598]|uniref:Aldehyde dehydrogenase domain-containing protein n=1 Tax=Piloderma croceum (strain F 1598) TaxID=765440 RepID=A0A0C3G4I6_PILCF|nr:hypothetical protein PILCRDRAFT_816768 [Piloderma croceum F 1598]
MPFTPLYIDGQWRPSSTDETFEVRNPQSNKVVGTSASASSQDCKDAVEAAARAFTTWEHVGLSQRRDIFIKAADILRDKYRDKVSAAVADELAITSWVHIDLMSSDRNLRFTASSVNELNGEAVPSFLPGAHTFVQKRPHGVIVGIAPWNVPMTLAIRAIAVPIICGNTVVLKSSEVSPRSQSFVAEIFHEAGLPKGVLNFISIARENAPALTAELIAHPCVRKINFAGSDRVGKILAAEAAKYLKPCVFELGGKAPAVVLNDADIEEASKAIIFGAMANSGQVCMSTERVIVQREASEVLISTVSALCKSIKAGDPTVDPSAKLTALFSAQSAENVLGLIQDAKDSGAGVLLGDCKRDGAIIQPHIITGVKPGMKIWDRETFGPVIVVAVVDTVDQAVELANSSDYSLTASVWTRNVHSAIEVASRIRASVTNINGQTMHVEPAAPMAGLGGASGYGCFDIANFTDKRTIIIHPPYQVYPTFG